MDKQKDVSLPSEDVEAQPQKEGWQVVFLDFAKNLLIALVLVFLVNLVIDRVRVENISMFPTLKEGDMLVVNKLAYKLGKVDRGDILTFHYPLDPKLSFIKRAIGLPGDTVEIVNKKVWVNGNALNEPYIVTPSDYTGKWVVPADSVFVLGDNRVDSADSHVWGFVPSNDLVGKVLAVYWPPNRMRIVFQPDLMASATP
jgi:signal peptidase I